jgi:hypothetical protein
VKALKKVGFIDYYLDEWHSDKYPEWIENASGGEMKVVCAYGMKDADGGLSNADWCAKKGIQLFDSIEAVVENSDYLIVLSPDHPEYHEELSALPLQSGKPTYIDKTFAPNRKTALHIFETAQKHGTPLYSSSALRFSAEYSELDKQGIETISSVGPGKFDNYAIHQIEPIVMLMGSKPKRVMYIGTSKSPALLIGFEDGRQAMLQHFGWECPFGMFINYDSGSSKVLKIESSFFELFINNLVTFFNTGVPTVQPSETIAIISIIEYGTQAAQTPYQWIELP